MPIGITRAYAPEANFDVERADLDSLTRWGWHSDARTLNEFLRFVHRDVIGAFTATVYGAGGMMFCAFQVNGLHTRDWIYVQYALVLILAVIAGVADVWLQWRAAPITAATVWIRQALAYVFVLVCLTMVSYTLPVAYARCDAAVDLAGYVYPRPPLTLAWARRTCINIVIVFHCVGYCIGYTAINIPPVHTFVIACLHFTLFYAGYGIENLFNYGEDTRSLLAKMMIYGFCAALVVVQKQLRFVSLRRQFAETIETERLRRRALAANGQLDGMLRTMVPPGALAKLLRGETLVSDHVLSASVLFSDMVGFTAWSGRRPAEDVVTMLNVLCSAFDAEAEASDVLKIKTIGDAYWATAGVPDPREDHAEALCSFGLRLLALVARAADDHPEWGLLQLRVGVASGAVTAAIFGTSRISYETYGRVTQLAQACEQQGVAGRVCVSEATVSELVATAARETGFESHTTVDMPWGREQLLLLPCLTALNSSAAAVATMLLDGTNSTKSATKSAADCYSHHDGILSDRASAVSLRSTSKQSRKPDGLKNAAVTLAAAQQARRAFLRKLERQRRQSVVDVGGGSTAMITQDSSLPLLVTSASMEATTIPIVGSTALVSAPVPSFHAADATTQRDDEEYRDVPNGFDSSDADRHRFRRRYSWLLFTFDDETLEAEYTQQFVLREHHRLRTCCRIAFVVFVVLCGIALGVEGVAVGAALPVAIPLLIISGIAGVGSLVLTLVAPEYAVTDATCLHVAAFCLVAGLWNVSASALSNDLTYLHPILSCILGFGTTGWPVALTLLLNVTGLLLPISVQAEGAAPFTSDIMFVLFEFIILALAFVSQELMFRRQFTERKMAQLAVDEQTLLAAEQHALLRSIVPPHVIAPILSWLRQGADPRQAPCESYPQMCVGFLKLVEPPAVHGALVRYTDESSGAVTSDLRSAGLTNTSLFAMHTAVDAALARFADSFDKIKSMGDTVMFAGPFGSGGDRVRREPDVPSADAKLPGELPNCISTGDDGQPTMERVSQTAVKMLLAIDALRSAGGGGGGVVCGYGGLHAGPVTGAVMGTARICFDVFGDTVNVASRTMTAAGVGSATAFAPDDDHVETSAVRVAATDAFRSLVAGVDAKLSDSRFAHCREVEAKGKGRIAIATYT